MAMQNKHPKTGKQELRSFDAEIREVSQDTRTVELSFSSEAPYARWFGTEILSHDKTAMELKRMKEVGTVLFSHGRDPLYGTMPIAGIKEVWIDEAEHKGRAKIQFDDDPASDTVFKKVSNGLLRGVSVGYVVNVWEEIAAGKKSLNGRFTGPASVASKWEPVEISITPTPADWKVGVGRDLDEDENDQESETEQPIADETKSAEINANKAWFDALREKINQIGGI
jgi:hypothetical protein